MLFPILNALAIYMLHQVPIDRSFKQEHKQGYFLIVVLLFLVFIKRDESLIIWRLLPVGLLHHKPLFKINSPHVSKLPVLTLKRVHDSKRRMDIFRKYLLIRP